MPKRDNKHSQEFWWDDMADARWYMIFGRPTAGVAIKHGGVRQVAHVEARLGTSCAKPSSIWFFNLIVVSPRWHRRGHGHTGVGRTSILRGGAGKNRGDWWWWWWGPHNQNHTNDQRISDIKTPVSDQVRVNKLLRSFLNFLSMYFWF